MTQNTPFKKLFERVEELRKVYMFTLASFTIFNEINNLVSYRSVGKKKAEENVKIMSNYNHFFSIIKETNRVYFLIELSKIFEKSKTGREEQTLTLKNIINYSEKNIRYLSKNDFLKYHKGRKIIPEIFESYKSLELCDLYKLKIRLKYNVNKIKNLNDLRDQALAHNDIKKKEIIINERDIKTLLNIVRDTIRLFYIKLDFSSNNFKNFLEEPVKDIRRMIDDLLKQHDFSRKEFEKRFGIKINP